MGSRLRFRSGPRVAPGSGARSGPETGLEAAGVEKALRGRPVLRGATFAAAPGEVVWIGGENGSGKTTLLRLLAAIFAPDAGVISFGGCDVEQGRAYRRLVGHVPPGDTGLHARLDVESNLRYAAGLAGLWGPTARRAVVRASGRLGLADLLARRVDRLSLGQRQRVRVACGVVHEPRLLLLDEPHTSLDEAGLAAIAATVEERSGTGAVVVWCSPPRDADRLPATRRFLIDGGRLVGHG